MVSGPRGSADPAGGRCQVAGGRRRVAGGRWLVAGSSGRCQVAGDRQLVAGGRWQVAGARQQMATTDPGPASPERRQTVGYRTGGWGSLQNCRTTGQACPAHSVRELRDQAHVSRANTRVWTACTSHENVSRAAHAGNPAGTHACHCPPPPNGLTPALPRSLARGGAAPAGPPPRVQRRGRHPSLFLWEALAWIGAWRAQQSALGSPAGSAPSDARAALPAEPHLERSPDLGAASTSRKCWQTRVCPPEEGPV